MINHNMLLVQWNRAVELWAEGDLFKPHLVGQSQQGLSNYTLRQRRDQAEYARICCTCLVPNGFAEPHVVAQGG